ncbi:Golgi-specific brefeldin A-resistance guanine nucleotide exchange factor 1-like isoform X2 [Corticium candelabrum]|uniref:Golgi-specific brefeldin A-resistance guanine nucleotide exchange factor 1-like isoform X2 n=1 Tax=Corticium candelabrum TaxID=121492 RepID=UPI002E269228|nr:Golgi-specific brefeldin A-resistance guanine nucleotide exchange factor 1-like isoform X2 [Corticium candelabrum]
MEVPRNGLYIVTGEISLVLAAMRRSARYAALVRAHEEVQDPLMLTFTQLKETLALVADLRELDVNVFVGPFLDVIRSEDTTGPITGVALSAVNKFLSYGLIDGRQQSAASGVENIADAVTHARFVGTDPANDEVVLMKILQVLRTLLLTPIGNHMTNESVCEIMQSCFRICFEARLSELLRRTAEHTLLDMVQLLFQRLKTFEEDTKVTVSADTQIRKVLKKATGSGISQSIVSQAVRLSRRKSSQRSNTPPADTEEEAKYQSDKCDTGLDADKSEDDRGKEAEGESEGGEKLLEKAPAPYVNHRGIKFTQRRAGPLVPYGLSCVRELFNFLITLINPHDRNNSAAMIQMGLSLIIAALENGCEAIGRLKSILQYIQDDLCKHLFQLLKSDNVYLFSLSVRVCFLLFEGLREKLKFQLEMFVTALMDAIGQGSQTRSAVEKRDSTLECVVQLCQIRHFVTELYLNYDADLYSGNVFEDLTKLLAKNAYPGAGPYSSHLLCLDALLATVNCIESNCHDNLQQSTTSTDKQSAASLLQQHDGVGSVCVVNDELCVSEAARGSDALFNALPVPLKVGNVREMVTSVSSEEAVCLPTAEQLIQIKQKKKLFIAGSEQFNSSPKKGIQFLQERGILKSPLDPDELAIFLRENPRLQKKMIGECVGDRKNDAILQAFVRSFHVEDVKIQSAMRVFLESFRLPGEAPIISRIMEHFSEHWLNVNSNNSNVFGTEFANKDCVYILCYGIILLNVDQHNPQNKNPMTEAQFQKNQRGLNDGKDFSEELLREIYKEIRDDEIIMPEEHEGQLKDDYQWTMMLRRSSSPDGHFLHVNDSTYDQDIFFLAWGPTIAALSVVFDGSLEDTVIQKAIIGFKTCASISAHYSFSDVFDNLVISLCNFTGLAAAVEARENVGVSFGSNSKAQLAATTLFTLAHRHGDILREGWKNLLDCLLHVFKAKLLPDELLKAEDFLDPSGYVSLISEEVPSTRSDSSLFSSLFSWTSESSSARSLSPDDRQAQTTAAECIQDCHPEALFAESKFLMEDSLMELVKALAFASHGPDTHQSLGTQFDEEGAVFNLELLLKVVVQNRDRILPLWDGVKDHLRRLLTQAESASFLVQRAAVGLLRLATRLIWREDMTSKIIDTLSVFLAVKSDVLHSLSRHITAGLSELLRSNASTITSPHDWHVFFSLIEACSTGVIYPHTINNNHQVDSNEIDGPTYAREETCDECDSSRQVASHPNDTNQLSLWQHDSLTHQDIVSLGKSSETLAFLIREAKCLTEHNFVDCIHAIRTLAETLSFVSIKQMNETHHKSDGKARNQVRGADKLKAKERAHKSHSTGSIPVVASTAYSYDTLSLQLLDLMQTLHAKAAGVFGHVTKEVPDDGVGFLWGKCWCPLLQGMACHCYDARRVVRQAAVTILQRSLLIHDLQSLSGREWELCFRQVFFPMLNRLLLPINATDPVGVEETRMRASALLSKVFLQHLTPLLSLPGFREIWMTVLSYMENFMHTQGSDLLVESIPESLKNMLLVMSTAGVFDAPPDDSTASSHSQLWTDTWNRIHQFLPGMHDELFAPTPTPRPTSPAAPPSAKRTTVPSSQHVAAKEETLDVNVSQEKQTISLSEVTDQARVVVLQPPLPSSAFDPVLPQPQQTTRTDSNTPPPALTFVVRPTSPGPGLAVVTATSSPESDRSRSPTPASAEGGDVVDANDEATEKAELQKMVDIN